MQPRFTLAITLACAALKAVAVFALAETADACECAPPRVLLPTSAQATLTRIEGKDSNSAMHALRKGLEVAPDSVDLRVALKDRLIVAGRMREACAELARIAAILVLDSEHDGAVRALLEALALDPSSQTVHSALLKLGHSPPR